MKRFHLEERRGPYTWVTIASSDDLELVVERGRKVSPTRAGLEHEDLRVMDTKRRRLRPLRELFDKQTRQNWKWR